VGGFAEESAASVFPADDRGWAAEVEVDPCDGKCEKFFSDADERWDVLANELGVDRSASVVFCDTLEDVFFQSVV